MNKHSVKKRMSHKTSMKNTAPCCTRHSQANAFYEGVICANKTTGVLRSFSDQIVMQSVAVCLGSVIKLICKVTR